MQKLVEAFQNDGVWYIALFLVLAAVVSGAIYWKAMRILREERKFGHHGVR